VLCCAVVCTVVILCVVLLLCTVVNQCYVVLLYPICCLYRWFNMINLIHNCERKVNSWSQTYVWQRNGQLSTVRIMKSSGLHTNKNKYKVSVRVKIH